MGFAKTALSKHDKPIRVVSIHDTDLDRSMMDVDTYAKSRDPAHLHLKGDDESPPVWFTLRPMDRDEIVQIFSEAASPNRAVQEVFRQACIEIKNLMMTQDGKTFPINARREVLPGNMRRLDDLTAGLVPIVIQRELGLLVCEWSKLDDETRKNS